MTIKSIAEVYFEKLKHDIRYKYFTAGGIALVIVTFYIFFIDNDVSLNKTPLLTDLYGYLNVWDNQADFWYSIQVILSFGAILASLTLTAFPKMGGENQVRGLAFVAALSAGFITAFQPNNMSTAYREAWRELNGALLECKADPNKCQTEVVDAYKKAEKIIGHQKITDLNSLK